MADYAVKTLKDLGLVGNGPDKTLGNIQDNRMQRMIEILTPIFAAQRKRSRPGCSRRTSTPTSTSTRPSG